MKWMKHAIDAGSIRTCWSAAQRTTIVLRSPLQNPTSFTLVIVTYTYPCMLLLPFFFSFCGCILFQQDPTTVPNCEDITTSIVLNPNITGTTTTTTTQIMVTESGATVWTAPWPTLVLTVVMMLHSVDFGTLWCWWEKGLRCYIRTTGKSESRFSHYREN